MTVEEATDLMASESFDLGENPEVPLALLGLSEDAVREDSRYTRSMEDSEYYDEEYVYEWSDGKEIKIRITGGKVDSVWLDYTRFDLSASKSDELTAEYMDTVDALAGQYFVSEIELGITPATMEELEEKALEGDFDSVVTFRETEEDSWFYIMAFRAAHQSFDSTTYAFSAFS